ncbi:MAG: glycosyltransferase [Planctomycetales bacterium]|nr:glycosyltransferase [Planctomycetales bacterium]
MRLLFFSNVFPNPLNPGKGTFNRSLVTALTEQHEMRVVCPISWVDEATARLRGQQFNLASQYLPDAHSISNLNSQISNQIIFPRFIYPPKLLRHRFDQFLSWSAGRTLRNEIRDFRPAAVLSYWTHPDGTVAVRAAHQAGIPAVVMTGGSDVLLLTQSDRRRQVILQTLRDADAVIAISRDIARKLIDGGIEADKIDVIPRGVDRTIFRPGDRAAARTRFGLPTDRPVLIAVGRLVPVKGFDVLVNACGELVRRGVPVSCHILGGGELRDTLANQIRQLQLNDHVTLHGSQDQSRLADWYRAADLTVLTSHSEGIPNVLLESIASGTPFVATSVGGVPEIADADWHRLVPPNDPARLADAIQERLNTVPVTESPSFQPLSWSESAERVAEVLRSTSPSPPPGERGDSSSCH